ncbi:zeta toxin [Curtobacterium sp. PhB130]|uniref:zeta toxin family protein n=1 Tax=Curtobacterium sp. PhB130 TaxID=2485178 RepID=UPI000F4B6C6C|nr:zeta toxin family protein [Curtobacterium sp. PhB130]ROS75776.1 zeta toxin [Curtobacterium sp. PhB130]
MTTDQDDRAARDRDRELRDRDLRDRTAAELAAFLQEACLDDPWTDDPAASSRLRYAPDGFLYTAERLRLHEELLAEHTARTPAPPDDGTLAVVVTAGPPGAGKTTALARMPELDDYRHIDADDFKDPLLERAAADGLLDAWTSRVLADGRPVQRRELAGYVHAESTAVADTLRRRSLRDGENVVVHGTLSSVDYLDDLLSDLDEAGYDRLRIVDVEVPLGSALEQATERWWQVRRGGDPLGGRFVPEAAIRRYYPADGGSRCRSNASELERRATDLGWHVTVERIG